MNIKLFLLNLDRSKDRLNSFYGQCAKLGIQFEKISAVDGSEISDLDVKAIYDERANSKNYYKKLGRGEVACYMTHKIAWKRIIDDNLDYAVIIEDDAILNSNFIDSLECIGDLNFEWDYIKLCEQPIKKTEIMHQTVKSHRVCIYNKIPTSTAAQIVNNTGAIKLLRNSESFSRPVDVDIQYWWESDLKVFGLKPYPVSVDESLPSIINQLSNRDAERSNSVLKIKLLLSYWFQNNFKTFQRKKDLTADGFSK